MRKPCIDCGKPSFIGERCSACYQRNRYHSSPEVKAQILSYNREWRMNNREKYNEISRISQAKWREENRDHYNEYHRNYRKNKVTGDGNSVS